MKKIFLLPALLLFLGWSASLWSQSPAQADISRLNSSLKMLTKLQAAPDWDNKGFVTRYGTYLKKAETAADNIREKDPAYDLATASPQIKSFRKAYDGHAKGAPADNDREAYWAKREQEKQARAAERDADEARTRARADSIMAAAQSQNSALQAQYEAEARRQQAAVDAENARRQAARANSKPRPLVDERPAGSVSVTLKNSCARAMEYCIDDGASVRFFKIGPNESALRYARPGSQVCRVAGSRKGDFIASVGGADGGKVYICKN